MLQFNGIRRRLLAAGLVALALAAGAFSAFGNGTTASALTNCTVADMSVDAEEASFLTLINNYRAQNGLPALAMSTNLNRASTWLAVDLATKSYFSHTDSLGRSPSTRAGNCDYPGGAGENIAAGTVRDTAQEAFDAWKASSGHNANMLNSSYRMIGIARHYRAGSPYGWYWVTNFGLVNDGTGGGGGGGASTPTHPSTGFRYRRRNQLASGREHARRCDRGILMERRQWGARILLLCRDLRGREQHHGPIHRNGHDNDGNHSSDQRQHRVRPPLDALLGRVAIPRLHVQGVHNGDGDSADGDRFGEGGPHQSSAGLNASRHVGHVQLVRGHGRPGVFLLCRHEPGE